MIDTHQHLIYPDRFSYAWTRDIPELQGTFRLDEYREAARGCDIEGTIFMEVDVEDSLAEAQYFAGLAADPASGILGVVAAGRPESADFEGYLDRLAHPKLSGIRRVLHTQPDALSQGSLFRDNLRLLGRRGLPFDLCMLQRQLGLAVDLARACAGTTFVLDHCGIPGIAANKAPGGEGYQQWKHAILQLANEPNVYCKISGLTVYAGPDLSTPDGLRPYVETVLHHFTPSRCLWGGDWPVVNLGSGFSRWHDLASELFVGLSEQEKKSVKTDTALKVYLSNA